VQFPAPAPFGYTPGMSPETAALAPRMKEVLYRCMEEIRATKAALYVSATAAFSENTFELVTHYGFADAPARHAGASDPLIDRLVTKRGVFFANGLNADPRLSELLFMAHTDRILIAPVFSRGRLVAFIDMRDKAGRQPFDAADAEAAGRIAGEILDLFVANNLFGIAPIALSEVPAEKGAPQPQIQQPESAASVSHAIERARTFVASELPRLSQPKNLLSTDDTESIRRVLALVLAIRGTVAAAVTARGHLGNLQLVAARGRFDHESIERFQASIDGWLEKRGIDPREVQREIFHPLGEEGEEIAIDSIAVVMTAPAAVASLHGLIFSVAFAHKPDAGMLRLLELAREQLDDAVAGSFARRTLQWTRERAAEAIVEPDFDRFRELSEHSRHVSQLASRFASHIGLPPAQVDMIRTAGYAHDAGLRILDRPYTKGILPPQERKLLREHSAIGAVLCERVLGPEIAYIVLCHHERWDGSGYPEGIRGEDIPLGARIVQICDAFVAMTLLSSYRPPIGEEAAIEQLTTKAGTQFDPTLVPRFVEMITAE
jgi:hypothetical protein